MAIDFHYLNRDGLARSILFAAVLLTELEVGLEGYTRLLVFPREGKLEY